MQTQYGDVAVTLAEHIATVEIQWGPNNFFDTALIHSLADAFEALDTEAACRAIVLAAAGKHFCAGANFHNPDAHSERETRSVETGNPLYAAAVRLFACRKPTVGAIQGAAIGGGLGWRWFPTSGCYARKPVSPPTSLHWLSPGIRTDVHAASSDRVATHEPPLLYGATDQWRRGHGMGVRGSADGTRPGTHRRRRTGQRDGCECAPSRPIHARYHAYRAGRRGQGSDGSRVPRTVLAAKDRRS